MKNNVSRGPSAKGPFGDSQYQNSDFEAVPQTRRMKLDPNQSYGMQVKRPAGEGTGEYQVVASPSEVKADQSRPLLICEACGYTSEKPRLTCPDCGSYFNSDVTQTHWDLERVRSKTRTTQTIQIDCPAELTWQQMLARRLAAGGIDLAILGSFLGAGAYAYCQYAARSVAENSSVEPVFSNISFFVLPVVLLLVTLFYNAFFECGASQATPGKICMGISVATDKGEALGLGEALWRSVVKLVPVMLVGLSAWMTRLLNPPVDQMSVDALIYSYQTVIIVAIFALLVYGLSLYWMSVSKKMQTLSDVITETIIS